MGFHVLSVWSGLPQKRAGLQGSKIRVPQNHATLVSASTKLISGSVTGGAALCPSAYSIEAETSNAEAQTTNVKAQTRHLETQTQILEAQTQNQTQNLEAQTQNLEAHTQPKKNPTRMF